MCRIVIEANKLLEGWELKTKVINAVTGWSDEFVLENGENGIKNLGQSMLFQIQHSPINPTEDEKLIMKRVLAHSYLREAEKAYYDYFRECGIGDERIRAAAVYENIRTASREDKL